MKIATIAKVGAGTLAAAALVAGSIAPAQAAYPPKKVTKTYSAITLSGASSTKAKKVTIKAKADKNAAKVTITVKGPKGVKTVTKTVSVKKGAFSYAVSTSKKGTYKVTVKYVAKTVKTSATETTYSSAKSFTKTIKRK